MKYIILFLLAFAFGFIFSIQNVRAEIQSLGKVGGGVWVYDDQTVTTNDNITGVWVLTNSKEYNVQHDKQYSVFGVHVLLDCSGRQYAIDRVMIFGKSSKVLHSSNSDKPVFSTPKEDTIPSTLLRWACGITG